jgi:hypothetical protein
MTRLSTSFIRDRELIIVEAEVVGRAGRSTGARLVLDTGAAATTLTPRVIQAVAYSRRDAYKESTVRAAIGEERGYWIHMAEFTALDVTTRGFGSRRPKTMRTGTSDPRACSTTIAPRLRCSTARASYLARR